MKATAIAGYTILVNAGHTVKIRGIQITDSGGLNAKKRNNTTGGILLEEGTTDFEVLDCRMANVRGNGIWTHSTSPRNARGRIANNEFAMIARDAVQVGHATEVRVEDNRGRMIGYPSEEVDLENQAFPSLSTLRGMSTNPRIVTIISRRSTANASIWMVFMTAK